MYHTSIINQVFSTKKSFSSKGFSQKDLQTYIAALTRRERDVIYYLLDFRQQDSQRLTNSTIATHVKCSVKTVTRATNKFHNDGVITKHQSHRYDINAFSFHEKTKKGPAAFSYWFNALPPASQDSYISHGVVIDHKNKKIVTHRNVPPYLSSSLSNSLFINSSLLFVRTREREPDFSKKMKGKIMESRSLHTKPIPKKSLESPKPFLTRKEIIKRIDECRLKLANPRQYVKYDAIKSSIVFFQKDLQQLLRDLQEYDDFASVSH